MRPITLRQSALGASVIIPLPWGVFGSGAILRAQFLNNPVTALTYNVEHTFDDVYAVIPATYTRAGTVLTVELPNHGLATNDHVDLIVTEPNNFRNSADLPIVQSSFLPTVVDANSFTVPVLNQGPVAGNIGITPLRMVVDSTLVAQIASAQGAYTFTPRGTRIRVTAYTSGGVDFTITDTAL
ncbi:hypothetical protein UFOVP435_32 [uncultured Caudovirales phage]|uniref:Uncharacterized protein n=1 Tax=uncultured Caudovirales phage TaxID=2100421 RepID=A0A6J5MD45_9CAUD|nr:hypothetical protein UFOVP435_32 [uncultured Caudovirales phage]